MRIVVEGDDGQVLDSATRDLTLPDYSTVQVGARHAAGLPRPNPSRSQALKANPAAPPTADREFTRTDRLLVRDRSLYTQAAPCRR